MNLHKEETIRDPMDNSILWKRTFFGSAAMAFKQSKTANVVANSEDHCGLH